MKLYELTSAYRQIDDAIERDVDDADLLGILEKIDGALKEKATSVAKVIQNIEATTDAIRAAEKRMADRRKALERRGQSIRDYILNNMVASDIHTIECPEFVLKVRDNPPAVVIDDETKIPTEYMRQPPPVPDKKAILDDIKEGVIVDGAHAERGKRLEIK